MRGDRCACEIDLKKVVIPNHPGIYVPEINYLVLLNRSTAALPTFL